MQGALSAGVLRWMFISQMDYLPNRKCGLTRPVVACSRFKQREHMMKNLLAVIAVAALAISLSQEVSAQSAPPSSGATKSTAATQQSGKGMAGQKWPMMTTCTPRQKMSGKPCS
ncbi:hypothetical protein AXW67_02795 [Bradyrhizobium neotropicale]|uniref:Uncharacterized protein n=2 Tax=Bradyrhizobium neotropicale TaxID=1497615 RepID=A0A176ZCV9_9BRAD|nr:hypothetical protein AXW67_02795 [Bradyrhizobium neotropicale]